MKTNSKVKKLIKPLIYFFLVELAIVICFLFAQNTNATLIEKDLEHATITVSDTYTERYPLIKGDIFCIIADNNIEYRISRPDPKSNDPTAEELKNLIQTGDVLTISYQEGISLISGKSNWIVSVAEDITQYRSIDTYNQPRETQQIFGIISFIVIETIYFIVLGLYTIYKIKELRLYPLKKNS